MERFETTLMFRKKVVTCVKSFKLFGYFANNKSLSNPAMENSSLKQKRFLFRSEVTPRKGNSFITFRSTYLGAKSKRSQSEVKSSREKETDKKISL